MIAVLLKVMKQSPAKKKSVLWTRLAYVLVILVTVGYYGYSREKDSAVSPDAGRPVTGEGVGTKETDSTAPSGQSRRFAVKRPIPPPNAINERAETVAGTVTSDDKGYPRSEKQVTQKRRTEPRADSAERGTPRRGMMPAKPEPEIEENKPDYSDASPPSVTAIRFDPQTVRQGESLSVFVRVTDNLSGVSSVSGVVRSPSQAAALPFRGQASEDVGTFVGTLTIPDRGDIGRWHFSTLRASDGAHNQQTYSEKSSLLRGAYFEVVGSTADTIPPNVTGVYLDPFEAYDGDRIKITVEVVDDESPIVLVYGVLESPSKHAKLPFSCRKEDGGNLFDGYVTIPADSESGEWTVGYLQVKDASQNTETFFRANHPDLFADARINVYASRSDADPPTLDTLSIHPSAALYEETVDIIVYASDDVSGVSSVSGQLQSPSRKAHIPFSCEYDSDNGAYKAQVTIPANAEIGRWRVDYIAMTDKARNQIKYNYSTTPVIQESYLTIIGE